MRGRLLLATVILAVAYFTWLAYNPVQVLVHHTEMAEYVDRVMENSRCPE